MKCLSIFAVCLTVVCVVSAQIVGTSQQVDPSKEAVAGDIIETAKNISKSSIVKITALRKNAAVRNGLYTAQLDVNGKKCTMSAIGLKPPKFSKGEDDCILCCDDVEL